MENANATKYQKRVTDKKNLEASNEFFVQFVEEVHRQRHEGDSGWRVQSLWFLQ